MTAAAAKPPSGRPLGYLPQFDGMRAFLTAVVVSHHYGLIPLADGLGHFCLRVFFVMSGYLITRIILADKPEANGLGPNWWRFAGRFYARRALRLLPIFYLTVLIGVVLGIDKFVESWPWHIAYLSNFWRGIAPQPQFPVGLYWSLAVEEQFYFLWPLVVMLVARGRLAAVCIALLVLAPLFRLVLPLMGYGQLGVGVMLPACMDNLAIGALLAVIGERVPDIAQRWRRYCGPLALAGGAALLVGMLILRPYAPVIVFAFYDSACVILGLMLTIRCITGNTGIVKRVLEAPPIQWLGKISYGIYVIHQLVLYLVVKELPAFTGALPHTVLALIAAALTIALASLSWIVMERPINDLKRHFPLPTHRTPARSQASIAVAST